MTQSRKERGITVALLWRGNPQTAEKPTPQNNRLFPLFKAFADMGVTAEPVVYSEEVADEVHHRLLGFDGVLVWVDPITDGLDRSNLNTILEKVAADGVWVSAHPEVIRKMGTKDVLFHTKDFGWGTDTHLYATGEEFRKEFPARLKSSGTRVVKQRRGNGGIGTWRVEIVGQKTDPLVRVQEARRGSTQEDVPLSEFLDRCENYFSHSGCIIDQPLQPRIGEGMIRCYLVHDKVVGFSTQMPRAQGDFAMAREKTMYTESEPRFANLRALMETDWVPKLQRSFGIELTSLPAIWDADFMYGPKDVRGEDSYVLGEINVSAVLPFPDSAIEKIARAAFIRLEESRSQRHRQT